MSVSAERIAHDIETIAGFSECAPTIGYSRPTFTPEWVAARDYVMHQAMEVGCKTRFDAAGNVHIRSQRFGWDEPLWLSGSHIDSVPTGGKYDGVVGIVAPLEVLRVAPHAPLELIIFAEEEGTTFNLGMLGSRAWAGTLSTDRLAEVKNRDGLNYLQAGASYGVDPYCLLEDRLRPERYRGLIELHVEQGPALWNADVPVAVVTTINGRRQYTVVLEGRPNHAGSTQMYDRFDALAGAAECIVSLEKLGLELASQTPHTVMTVGRLLNEPNGLNVIPGRTSFYIDFRARNDDVLAEGDLLLRTAMTEIAARRGLGLELTQTESLPATPLDAGICDRLRHAAGALGVPLPDAASGALHDAAILAPYVPTAMLFIASEGGISHNPAEYSRIEDIALATRILLQAVST